MEGSKGFSEFFLFDLLKEHRKVLYESKKHKSFFISFRFRESYLPQSAYTFQHDSALMYLHSQQDRCQERKQEHEMAFF